jgi:hypothetical protein
MEGSVGSTPRAVEVRPSRIWFVASAAAAALAAASAIDQGSWWWLAGCGVFVLASASALREFIGVSEQVPYRRTLWSWDSPVDLNRLATVWFGRTWGFREFWPHRELHLTDADGNSTEISLRWWAQPDRLIDVIALSALEQSTPHDDSTEPRLSLDDKTRCALTEHPARNGSVWAETVGDAPLP